MIEDVVHELRASLRKFGLWGYLIPRRTRIEPEALLLLQSAAEDFLEEVFRGAYAMRVEGAGNPEGIFFLPPAFPKLSFLTLSSSSVAAPFLLQEGDITEWMRHHVT